MARKSEEERIKKSKEEFNKKPFEIEDVLKIVKECLEINKIDGEAKIIENALIPKNNRDYLKIKEKYRTNKDTHIIWIEFVDMGHIAVVGAGKDIGFPKSGRTWETLNKLSKLVGSDIEWNKEKIIVIPVRGLDKQSVGAKNVKNILKCRNGVEQCIGNYLIGKGVPVLNYYSHMNCSENAWNTLKKNNYNI